MKATATTTREYREKLIDEVKRFPVLYDTRHELHRDIDARDRCWADIAARLGTNCEIIKREWKILRDSLRQSLKKACGGVTTKSGTPCKRWRFQTRMAFLLPHMTRRKQRHNLRNDIKLDMETEPSEVGESEEWAGGGASGGVGGGAAAGEDALELFFASVCASARRLPPAAQRALKRRVLDALLRCEAEAETPAPAPATASNQPSSTELLDEFSQQND